ncbi:MAG: Gfo/Idh/MocA family oxidoreductase [Candidatus Omnitrophica bacterium]|nr:Gfo/Idh/MocA family oxidoreductase [Candidatus Omnitrophota bacterium]
MEKVRVGIIGAGGRANFQTKSIIDSGIGEVVIVYSPFQEEVKSFSEKYGIKYTTSLEDILNNSEISAVTISTPNATHYEISKKALLNNKNILVEYPPTLKIEEVDELINIAKEKNLVYWVSLTQLLENPFYTIKKNLNMIGRPLFSYFTYISSFLGGWYSESKLCGPLYIWQHYHFVSQLLDIYKDVEEVSAFENIEYDKEGKMSLTSSVMNLKFSSGFISTIEFAMGVKNARDFKLKFVGENGIFYFDDGKLYFINKETGKKEIGLEEISTKIDTLNYLKKVSEKKLDIETAVKAREALKICLCAEVSAKEKKIVKVE